MIRFWIDGNNDEALAAPASDCRELISGLNPDADKRLFIVKRITLQNSHASQVGLVDFFDQDEAAATATNQVYSGVYVNPGTTLEVEFEDKGESGIRIATNLTAGVTNGTFAVYEQSAGGYLV